MPLNIYDIRDKCEVLHANEIAAAIRDFLPR